MVSSMSETMPSFVSGGDHRISASAGSVPSARSTAVCQPGDSHVNHGVHEAAAVRMHAGGDAADLDLHLGELRPGHW